MDDIDIYRSAAASIDRHGDEAHRRSRCPARCTRALSDEDTTLFAEIVESNVRLAANDAS